MQYQITLQAGIKKRQEFTGSTLVLVDLGAAPSIDMNVEIAGFAVEELRSVKRGLKINASGFTGASFSSPVDTTIQVIASQADLSINYQDGSKVDANISSQAIELVVKDADANVCVNRSSVAVTDASGLMIEANPLRKSLRICNLGANPIAIGGAGISWANRCIVIFSGDTFFEDRAPHLAWFAVSEAGKASTVAMQELNK